MRKRDRSQFQDSLDFAREGNVLVIAELSRLPSSTKQLIEAAENVGCSGIKPRVSHRRSPAPVRLRGSSPS